MLKEHRLDSPAAVVTYGAVTKQASRAVRTAPPRIVTPRAVNEQANGAVIQTAQPRYNMPCRD